MKRILLISTLCSLIFANEKYFVVERENSSLAVIDGVKVIDHVENMHDMNHGVVKFFKNDGYAITRDGYVIRFSPETYKIISEYKTSKSAIGFVVEEDYVAVANYDDKSIDILDKDLKPIQKIITNSRNVGIKTYKNYLIFSEMDKDQITVLKRNFNNAPFFSEAKVFKDVGIMPFDAMMNGSNYIVGFFKGGNFGVLNLENMQFNKISILIENNQPVLKIPHFGFWSISNNQIFIPSVGDNKVQAFDEKFNHVKSIDVHGLPVFTSLSPNGKFLAVTFSGEKFPYVEIIDTKSLCVIKQFKFDGKVLHIRWSKEKPLLYVSVNDTNKLAVINTEYWMVSKEILNVKKPSGIFVYEE